jgi:hypothetical protein
MEELELMQPHLALAVEELVVLQSVKMQLAQHREVVQLIMVEMELLAWLLATLVAWVLILVAEELVGIQTLLLIELAVMAVWDL